MNWNPFKRERDLLDIFHLLITLAIAVGGFLINQKQAELNRKIEREKAVQTFTDKIFTHLEKFNLSDVEKEAMVIDLLDIITESNISKTGELSDTERRQLMPLRIALVTENHEILSHIGADSSKRALWVKFAEHSGSAKVKLTAIRALENLGRYGGKEGYKNDLLFSLEKIQSLSEDFNDKSKVTMAVVSLVEIMDYETMRENINSSKADSLTIAKVYELLFEQRSNLELEKSSVLVKQKDSLQTVWQKVDQATDKLANLLDIPIVEEVHVRTRDLEPDTTIIAQIEQLTSETQSERKSARVSLASLGENALEPLLNSLKNERLKDKYLVRLGVAKSLNLMKQPVTIHNADDVAVIVELIGDSKSEIRTNAAEFLMQLTDPQTVNLVYEGLKNTIRDKNNGNAVYNAVIILGTWLRILPTPNPTKTELNNYLHSTKTALINDKNNWTRTIAVIDELLKKALVK